MKKILQYLGLFGIMIFSFYYTNKAALIAKNSNPIMKNINDVKESLSVSSIDAVISGDYIIPGLNGLEVDTTASFNKMRPYNVFNKYYMVYNQIPPKISLEDNKEKIIISGNKSKKEISIIINYNNTFINYLKDNKLKYDILTTLDTYKNDNERINADKENFKELNKLLDKDNINKHICVTNSNIDIEECKKNKYYLVKATELNQNNIIEIKNQVSNGSIIFINDNLYITHLEVFLNYVKSKGLEIVYLSELITETKK